MYSTAWVNQFEIKDTCVEFVINNVSPQGNNMKIKLNLKVEEIYCKKETAVVIFVKYMTTHQILFSFITGIYITL